MSDAPLTDLTLTLRGQPTDTEMIKSATVLLAACGRPAMAREMWRRIEAGQDVREAIGVFVRLVFAAPPIQVAQGPDAPRVRASGRPSPVIEVKKVTTGTKRSKAERSAALAEAVARKHGAR